MKMFIGLLCGALIVAAVYGSQRHGQARTGPARTATTSAVPVQVCAEASFNTTTFHCSNTSVTASFADDILAIACTDGDCGPGDGVYVSIAGTDAYGNVSSGGGVVDFTNIHTAYDGQKGWVYLNDAFHAANVLIAPGMTYRLTVTDPNDSNGSDLGSVTVSS